MKIVLIGAPGSGKSWLAQQIAQALGLEHIEADTLFWENGNEVSHERFRERVKERLTKEKWIFEGHIGKLGGLVLHQSNKIILVDTPHFQSLARSFKRDFFRIIQGKEPLKHLKKILYNCRHHVEMKERRDSFIKDLRTKRPNDVLTWSNADTLEEFLNKLSNSV